MKNEGVIKKI